MTVQIGIRAVAQDGMRWNPQRKLKILNDLDRAGDGAREALMATHGLSADEVEQWRGAYHRHGMDGLAIRKQACR